MPNIGAVLKQEISRIARKEIRDQVQTTKKASVQFRRYIAALKRQVTSLQRDLASLSRQTARRPAPAADSSMGAKARFVPKGLRAQRSRLGLSAESYGKLVGVSAQSIYNWEQGHAKPRAEQMAALAALRGVGKRDAVARLGKMPAKRKAPAAKT